ncbi:MAG TPA: hypothetical protein VIT00_00975 [Terrimicrobiaceae bacterium]
MNTLGAIGPQIQPLGNGKPEMMPNHAEDRHASQAVKLRETIRRRRRFGRWYVTHAE